jgi:hypothetical protein
MGSTTTLRCDTARTGTNPDFTINANPWRKYVSIDLGQTTVGGNSYDRTVRAGVLVVENWLFNAGPHQGETRTLVLVATTTNEVFCYSEGDLLENGAAATPLWQTPLGVVPIVSQDTGGQFSNIRPLLGVCGTPVVDTASRRMFVVAMWDDGSGTGHYSIFNLALDTGSITASQELVDGAGPSPTTFNGNLVDQRTAINLVGGWLWFGFGAFFAFDQGRYYGWVVAVSPDDLTQQLFQPMISFNSSNRWGVYAAGVWGPGGVAAADDGSVFALTGNATQFAPSDSTATNGSNTLTAFGMDYWGDAAWSNVNDPTAGPGSLGDYFNGIVHVGVDTSGSTPKLKVQDWFQGSTFTQAENSGDFDFGGSSPLVLPSINGRQFVAFVPKDGDIFVLDSQQLGNFTTPLTRQTFANAFNAGGNDTKTALAFLQTPDGRNILIVGADSNGPSLGGFAAFELDATATPPTLTKLWQAPALLRDSFGSPSVIANPVPDPSNPPSPIGLAWVIDGDDPGGSADLLQNCAMRAYDVLSGAIAYDSTVGNDISEQIPHFSPITSGGNSVFAATSKGFMGFTQFVQAAKSLSFIVDRSTFGLDEVDSMEKTSTSVASFGSAYWIAVSGVLPSDIGLTSGNLMSPPQKPTVMVALSSLPGNVSSAITNMLSAAQFTGPVIPQDPSLPDQPQTFLFPYTIAFTGDQGFQAMKTASIGSTLVTLTAAMPGIASGASTQIELVTGENPFFVDVNPQDPTQPTWLSFDLRLFKVTLAPNAPPTMFSAPLPSTAADAPAFIAEAIKNLTMGNGTTADGGSFEMLTQDEVLSALEFNPTNSSGQLVFNFAIARVRLVGKTTGPTPYPVRVFFRLFQAQNTVSNFDTTTTYRFATDGTTHGRKVPLLGVQNDANGSPEYVTIPCFATPRINLTGPANMDGQGDLPNAYPITIVTPGVEVDSYFGCWIDSNQTQAFLPKTPPAGMLDGPWTNQWMNPSQDLQSIQQAITPFPHQCLIAEIRYDDAPVVPNATSATSDKLAQRNIAWIDAPNPGVDASRRMSHPIQVRPTPRGIEHPDELMIFWGRTPAESRAELYLPALSAATIAGTTNRLYPKQHMRAADPHTVTFDAKGVSFVPLPAGTALAAGLLTVMLPPGIRKGDQYTITVRQLTDAEVTVAPQPPAGRLPADRAARDVAAVARRWRRVAGAFQFIITVKTKEAILLNQERLLATLRWILLGMPKQKRWFPVLQRYITYVAGVVGGSGGQPNQIEPSPTGWVPGMPKPLPAPPPHHPPHGGAVEEFTGKIQGLIYDRFGDFEGFVLETMTGAIHRIFSRERAVRDLAQHAQVERLRVHVVVERDHWRLRQMVVL